MMQLLMTDEFYAKLIEILEGYEDRVAYDGDGRYDHWQSNELTAFIGELKAGTVNLETK